MEKILRLKEVQDMTGLSRSAIYQLIARGQFPKQIKLSIRAAGWRSREVQEWIDSRQSA
jgi:prophage regulatory protein